MYVQRKHQNKWLRDRGEKQKNCVEDDTKIIKFAKELFLSWDINGDGSITQDELIKPLVGLGLVPDHKFAAKICYALENTKSEHGNVELTAEDFLKIFKPDRNQDHLMKILKRATAKRLDTVKMPSAKNGAFNAAPETDSSSLTEQTESIDFIW
jgi:hypothetical protein